MRILPLWHISLGIAMCRSKPHVAHGFHTGPGVQFKNLGWCGTVHLLFSIHIIIPSPQKIHMETGIQDAILLVGCFFTVICSFSFPQYTEHKILLDILIVDGWMDRWVNGQMDGYVHKDSQLTSQ